MCVCVCLHRLYAFWACDIFVNAFSKSEFHSNLLLFALQLLYFSLFHYVTKIIMISNESNWLGFSKMYLLACGCGQGKIYCLVFLQFLPVSFIPSYLWCESFKQRRKAFISSKERKTGKREGFCVWIREDLVWRILWFVRHLSLGWKYIIKRQHKKGNVPTDDVADWKQ